MATADDDIDLLFRMRPRRGRISGDPTNVFGQGGNFIPRRRKDSSPAVRSLRGKTTPGSDIDLVTGGRKNKKSFVRFEARPVRSGNVRSELAVGPLTDFDQPTEITTRFRADALDPITGTAYLLQIWQPVISPIAGLRVQGGRLEATTRSGGTAWSTRFREGKWYNFRIEFQAGDDGFFRIYGGKSGRLLGEVEGRIDGGSQAGRARQDSWRPKLGFYGSSGNSLNVDYSDFSFGLG